MEGKLYLILALASLLAFAVLLCYTIIESKTQKKDKHRKTYSPPPPSEKRYRTYREAKTAEMRAPANPANHYTTYNEREDWDDFGAYIPKYAAGDEMDRINRQFRSSNKQKFLSPLLVCLGLAISLYLVPKLSAHNLFPTPQPALAQTQISGIDVEYTNVVWEEESITLDAVYKNETATPYHNLNPKFELMDETGTVIQTFYDETISTLPAFGTIEKNTVIPLDVDLVMVKQVRGEVHYVAF